MKSRTPSLLLLGALALPQFALPQTAEMVPVVSKQASRMLDLPGEFLPFLSVSLHAKIPGYVERISVDRGSVVKAGDPLIELSAPEMAARIAELESKVQAMEADRLQAEAQVSAAQSTYDRLKKASETVGAIAGNELIQSQLQVEAARASVHSREQAKSAAQASVNAEKEIQSYLKITAPFDGVVTDRYVHPGALVGPGADPALLKIEQLSQLRLVVALPEEHVGSIAQGAKVVFQVPAYPERTFSGTVARVSHTLDKETRTMAVELDVVNHDGTLAPGMYPTVKWPVRRARPALFVPKTSVVTTAERVFVIHNKDGRAEWVDVRKGAADGDLIEVLGDLKPGDLIVRRANDEMRDGAPLKTQATR